MEHMQRVAIIGCGGSGKTTVGRRLAAALGTTITHLDAVYYDDEWHRMDQDKFAKLQQELVAAETWVIDGNYASTLPIRLRRATHVVFLDLPAATCLWGIARRRWRHRGRSSRQDDQTGVYDQINWGFIRYILGYRRDMAPHVRKLIAERAGHAEVHMVTSRRAANALATDLERTARP